VAENAAPVTRKMFLYVTTVKRRQTLGRQNSCTRWQGKPRKAYYKHTSGE